MEFGNGGLDGASEIWKLVEHEVFEVREVADERRDLARESRVGEDGEGHDPVGLPITFDAVPSATIFFRLP